MSNESQAKLEAEMIFSNLNVRDNYINYEDFLKGSIDKDELITDKNLKLIFRWKTI